MNTTITVRLFNAAVAGTLALTIAQQPHIAPTYPPIGTPSYNASCAIVRTWEDGGAQAYCRADGETYLYDADGGFIEDHGIRFYYRAEGSWYVAPERWQIGPGAREDGR